jgi:hypothetical protein
VQADPWEEELIKKEKHAEQVIAPIVTEEEPQPEEKDRPNRVVLGLTLLGFILVISLCFAFIGFLPFGLVVLFFCAPVLGALSFMAAMLYRRKIVQEVAQGKTGEKYRLSNYFLRFRDLLYVYFATVLLALLGFGLVYGAGFGTANFIVYLLGVLMLAAGSAVIWVTVLLLLAFSLFYLFKWRKYPDGNAPRMLKKKKAGS